MKKILLYDTTLRDGSQGENINFSVSEKIRIAKKLDDLGIHYIEGGWPLSNPKDKEFFKQAQKIKWQNTKITAFGSTRRKNTKAKNDPNLLALLDAQTPAITIFGKSWDLHATKVLKTTLEENLAMIYDSVKFLKSQKREIIYDAEHYFDGYKNNPNYALATIREAIRGGARTIVLCETNGGCLPYEIEEITKKTIQKINNPKIKFGIHAHNDSDTGTANSITAIRAGARMVQGTMNGYGERCGNADLTSIIPILKLKMNHDCINLKNLAKLSQTARYINELANVIPNPHKAFVGKSAFAHKAGIHVSGIMRESRAYEHMDPTLVGNVRRILASDLAGKSNIEYKAQEMNVKLENDDSQKITQEIKNLEQAGYQFDGADASLKILMQKHTNKFKQAFDLQSFEILIRKVKNEPSKSQANVNISVKGKSKKATAQGEGPVSALDNALRKALIKFFPKINKMRLADFKVRVIDGRDGTGAQVRVLIESRDNQETWNTLGVSQDIIEASWYALADSIYYYLNK